jgi:nanoRNase/pAp phosphatase (c-di-AMP/oligoRNAs hydrolase)
MRSVVYIEEDYIAGLLKDYFVDNGRTTYIVTDPAAKRHLASHGQAVSLAGTRNAPLRKQLADPIEFLLLQSDDLARIRGVLAMVDSHQPGVPTLVISSERDEVAAEFPFVYAITMQQLLEGDLRWQIVLAGTARRLQQIVGHFDGADSVLILLQDDPDPDAIASGLALRQVLGRHKQTAVLGSFGRITRPENLAMTRLLEIGVEPIESADLERFDRIAVVDMQPPHVRTPLPRVDLVIDHHPEQTGYEATIRDVRPSYGATATMLVEYLLCRGNNVGTRLATALLYGIKSDTFLLGRETNAWDVEAFSYLYPLANHNLLRRIERPELPPTAIDALGRALRTRRVRDKVAFVFLGSVEREDLIPQIADFCLQFEGVEWAVVSGIFESDLVISVRNVGYVKAAGKVLKDAFGGIGAAGGHGSMAKAIIPLEAIARRWKATSRNTAAISEGVERRFLRCLRSPSR